MNIKEIIFQELSKEDWYKKNPISLDNYNENFLEYFDPWEYEEEFNRDSHRWWDEMTVVKKIGDKYFQYTWASANRDESIFELGWSFDESSIIEVEPYEETTIVRKFKKVVNG